ncbi:hypothetical protein [Comamonas sp. JC664]|uniref:hypothetical protein n=1 Tax=Comamonas sp. JC664 TaxID=2801917 RepID=UPI00360B1E49
MIPARRAADGRLPQVARLGEKSAADYSFHVAVTWWSEQVPRTWACWCATRASTASSTSWLQERHHVR